MATKVTFNTPTGKIVAECVYGHKEVIKVSGVKHDSKGDYRNVRRSCSCGTEITIVRKNYHIGQ